ncbi:PREDICTED: B-cell antigen receptor complex-associated protein beta chain isoform X2 [Condylura cristata]|uniref:B-cell antigen receptor complex-associated protein beta chain isoform X2 n=1 Tax=Condylura cristata TaxID=143302 RepID=UPI0003346C4A|nr:PREDICTED: B-cell antigen receptor complex-associated protein beta chain isoform X2 [Condylura cristata]
MAGLTLSPMPSAWLVVLLLLLSGEPVPAANSGNPHRNFKGSTCSRLWQIPRFVARKRGSNVTIACHMESKGNVTWYWKPKIDAEAKLLPQENGHIQQKQDHTISTLTIWGIQVQDNGIYYCHQECPLELTLHTGCGTELRVMGFSTVEQVRRRNTLKDGIIMIQTLLIILFIIVPIFLLLDKDDSKSGMEEDHTYEGLDIDQTATYEDIVTLRTGEVKWSVGEHPSQE